MNDETPDAPGGVLRSLRAKLGDREPLDEGELLESRPGPRITWPLAFVIATIAVCLTTVYIMSKWAEWDCKRDGRQWVGSDGIEPDNFCIEPPP